MRAFGSLLAFVATLLSSCRFALVVEGLNVRDNTKKQKDVLVVVMGQLRGSEMAWESLRRRVLTPWAADLAVMTDVTDAFNKKSSLFRDAVYKWHEQEHGDWGEVLDRLPGYHPRWRDQLCPMFGGQFLGGVMWNSSNGTLTRCHKGSSGILLAYRALVQWKLRELRSEGIQYKWIVITRADYFFACDMPGLDTMHADAYNVPDFEGYGGITDRFSVFPGDLAEKVLNVSQKVISAPTFWKVLRTEWNHEDCKKQACNLEKVLDRYAQYFNLKVHKYKHPAFTVKAPGDPGSWSVGVSGGGLGYYNLESRYPWEFQSTKWLCGDDAVDKELANIHSKVAGGGAASKEDFRIVVGNETIYIH